MDCRGGTPFPPPSFCESVGNLKRGAATECRPYNFRAGVIYNRSLLPAFTNLNPSADSAPQSDSSASRWRALVLLATAELLGMSLWFSGSAVVPALRTEWNLSEAASNWLTLAVQIGFVCGTLLSAIFNLPDILRSRYLFALTALFGALANWIFGMYATGPKLAIALRFLTGMFLAGVYPPAMKIMATWFRRGRGMALGILVGALTLG